MTQGHVDDENAGLGDDGPEGVAPLAGTAGWTDARLRVHRWLSDRAPGFAPVYEAIVHMLTDPAFPGRVWFVAHALRDMRNRLPDAIAGPVKGSTTQYKELAERIKARWLEDGLPGDGSAPVAAAAEPSATGPARVEVSATLVTAVGELVAGHLAIGPRMQESARRLWDAVGGQPAPDYAVRTWLNATKHVERFAHMRTKPLTDEDVSEFEALADRCETALVAMASKSFENMDEIDAILGSTNR